MSILIRRVQESIVAMGRKKAKRVLEEEQIDIRCYYCNKGYNDEKSLIGHQKNKHFKVSLVSSPLLPGYALK